MSIIETVATLSELHVQTALQFEALAAALKQAPETVTAPKAPETAPDVRPILKRPRRNTKKDRHYRTARLYLANRKITAGAVHAELIKGNGVNYSPQVLERTLTGVKSTIRAIEEAGYKLVRVEARTGPR